MKLSRIVASLCFLLFFSILSLRVYSATGSYCTTSPCTCGSGCQNGGYETSNGFNTIDSCQDGNEDTYEYVHDITATDQSGSIFRVGDTVEIDAHVDCDSDGDEVSLVYYNGTAWKSVYSVVCSITGKTHYYYNITLDNNLGNQSVRATLAYAGASGMTCAYSYDNIYSDTDDITFQVQDAGDIVNPVVNSPQPSIGQTFNYFGGLLINISANVTDNTEVFEVVANVTWGTKSELVYLYNSSGSSIYRGNFTNTTDITRYNFTIYAYDIEENLNDSIKSSFSINQTTNITFAYPSDGVLYPSDLSYVEYQISPGPEVYSSYAEITGYSPFNGINKKISNEDSVNAFEDDYFYNNLSQSFYFAQDTYVDRISLRLKKNGTGTTGARVEIRNSSQGYPSNISLGHAEINSSNVSLSSSWVNFTFNQTIVLYTNTTYWLFISPNGSATDFYSFEVNNNTYSGGNYSNNVSKDILFKIFDKYRFNISFVPEEFVTSIQAFANTSSGIISSGILTVNYDFEYPTIGNFQYTPSDVISLDPNTVINVTADITDNLGFESVYMQYMLQNDSDWTNRTFTYQSGSLYRGNLTVMYESNVTIKVVAIDTSGLESTETDLAPVFYEWNWSIIPSSFNATGALINTNATVGTLSIVSSSDFPINFNLNDTSDRETFFNGTNQTIMTVPANSVSSIIVSATGASTLQQDTIIINIDALNESSEPSLRQSNFSLVSYLSGPYLFVDIVEYDASVTQGDHINSLKAKVSNVGNETANNVTVLWTLPSGWTSRDDLNTSYVNISSGGIEVKEFKISADVPGSSETGEHTLLVETNSSEGRYNSDSRTVTVSSSSSPQTTSGSSSGDSSSSSVPSSPVIVTASPDISINISELKIPRGESYRLVFKLQNNLSYRTFSNISLELEGLFRSFYNISPEFIQLFEKDDSIEISLEFNLPSYYPEGSKYLVLLIKPEKTKIIEKQFKIVVYDRSLSIADCLETSLLKIKEMGSKGVQVDSLLSEHEKAAKGYENSDYSSARGFCSRAENLYDEFLKQNEEIILITGRVAGLKSEGYSTAEIEKFLGFIKEAFYSGNFEKSKEFLNQAQLLLQAAIELEKPLGLRLSEFYNLNKSFLIALLISAPVLFLITGRVVYITRTQTRINKFEEEKKKVITFIKSMQDSFYNKHLLSQALFKEYNDQYKKRIGEIEINLAKLRFRQKHYLSEAGSVSELHHQRNEILKFIKNAQEDYYSKKVIDKDSYEILESYYSDILAQIEAILPKDKQKLKASRRGLDKPDLEIEYKSSSYPVGYLIEKNQGNNNVELSGPENIQPDAPVHQVLSSNSILLLPAKPESIVLNSKTAKATESSPFYLRNGKAIAGLKDLLKELDAMENSVFEHHVNSVKNDFAAWIKDIFKEEELSEKISKAQTKEQVIEALKDYFLQGGKIE